MLDTDLVLRLHAITHFQMYCESELLVEKLSVCKSAPRRVSHFRSQGLAAIAVDSGRCHLNGETISGSGPWQVAAALINVFQFNDYYMSGIV